MRLPRLSALQRMSKAMLVAVALVAASAVATPALASAATPAPHVVVSTTSTAGTGGVKVVSVPRGTPLAAIERQAKATPDNGGVGSCIASAQNAYAAVLTCQVIAGEIEVLFTCSNNTVYGVGPLYAGTWRVSFSCYPYILLNWQVESL